ncbi:hypothetical protein EBF04_00145 [Streptomyces sp. I6]|nr:hypothetical protein EBF04_00145 [Streptomyces sp. I6]
MTKPPGVLDGDPAVAEDRDGVRSMSSPPVIGPSTAENRPMTSIPARTVRAPIPSASCAEPGSPRGRDGAMRHL